MKTDDVIRKPMLRRTVSIARPGWRRAHLSDNDDLPRGPSPVPPREERIMDATLRAGQQ